MSVIKLLEDIANSYLQVLAEGGIQLALEGNNIHSFYHHHQYECPLSSLKYIKGILSCDISSQSFIDAFVQFLITRIFTSSSR